MSQDNENKPEDIDFGFNSNDHSSNDGANPFANEDFNPFADGSFSFDPDGTSDSPAPTDENTFDFPSFNPDSTNSEPNNADETPFSETNEGEDAGPSPFLMGTEDNIEEDSSESEENTADVAPALGIETKVTEDDKKEKKKKGKTEKKKKKEPKEKKSGSGIGLGGGLSLFLGLLLLGILIAYNVFVIMYPDEGIGFTSTIYYLVGVDVFGLFAVAVPFMFFFNREKKDTETSPEQKLDFFKVVLGVSTIAMSLGVIMLLTAWYRYDFETKPTQSLPSLSMPSPESSPVQ